MTDFEKLMDLLGVTNKKEREELFEGLTSYNIELVLCFREDGSISWGTLGE